MSNIPRKAYLYNIYSTARDSESHIRPPLEELSTEDLGQKLLFDCLFH
jgi:hypothetical protein